jgi:hypothetical protein
MHRSPVVFNSFTPDVVRFSLTGRDMTSSMRCVAACPALQFSCTGENACTALPGGRNLAYAMPVVTSSILQSQNGGFEPDKLVDCDPNATAWSSAYAPPVDFDWAYVDLQQDNVSFASVKLYWPSGGLNAQSVSLWYTSGASQLLQPGSTGWTLVKNESAANLGPAGYQFFCSKNQTISCAGRFLGLLLKRARSNYPVVLTDFQVYA